ncbi:MAG: GNAT family N-acetyltransferase [Bacteroidetes bacterium]|nr:GNAT family N-acetyltransferase [Bacteroidota bacterium]
MTIDLSLLKGRYVYLELLTPAHREAIHDLAGDMRIWEFTRTLSREKFEEQFDAYFNLALDTSALGGQQAFVIRRTDDDSIIGMTRFYAVLYAEKKVEIGYTWYTPSVWGKVHNKECKLLMLQYIFETLHFMRAEFKVVGWNIRSQKAVEKIGGVREAYLRKTGYAPDGNVRDTVIFGIIDDEWPVKKEKLQQLIAESEKR